MLLTENPRLTPYIRHLAWSPTGTDLAATSGATIKIWNPEKPNVKASQDLKGHVGVVERVAWRPTRESELASTGSDGTVKLWDVRIGAVGIGKSNVVQDIKVGDHGLFMTWSPNGNEIVVGRRDDVIVPIDVRMGMVPGGPPEALEPREGRKLQTAQTNQIAFSNSGKEVFATTGDGLVKVLDWPSMVSAASTGCVQTLTEGIEIASYFERAHIDSKLRGSFAKWQLPCDRRERFFDRPLGHLRLGVQAHTC